MYNMTIHLPPDLESSIQAAVDSGHFASEDDMVAAAVRDYLQRLLDRFPPVAATPAAVETLTKRKPLWERAAELRNSIPEEEWATLPADGAVQLDHYIYGSPKRSTS
jgi:Arc/MetJ-type ribon-helix-helix transcriptional regulator